MNQKHVLIVGGGFSGTMVAYHLVHNAKAPVKVTVLEKTNTFGKGMAYGTSDTSHLLNVPALNMSARPEKPSDFLDWLTSNNIPADPGGFYPRKTYGEYIQSLLSEAIAKSSSSPKTVSLDLVDDEAVSFEQDKSGKLAVRGRKNNLFQCDRIVMALGHFPPGQFANIYKTASQSPRYITRFWTSPMWPLIPKTSNIAIIGTGLSMIDAAVSLISRNHQGQVYAISRRGQLPQPHGKKNPEYKLKVPESVKGTVCSLTRFIRQEIKNGESTGQFGWRDVVDGLRPITNALWQSWPTTEKKRFLRHLRPYWEVHRHRMSPKVASVLEPVVKSKQLVVQRARMQSVETLEDGFVLHSVSKTDQQLPALKVNYIIDCSGSESNYRKLDDPFLKSILEGAEPSGEIDPLGLGVITNEVGQLTNCNQLYAIGPLCKGTLFETTAVPELRVQAERLALHLLESLP